MAEENKTQETEERGAFRAKVRPLVHQVEAFHKHSG